MKRINGNTARKKFVLRLDTHTAWPTTTTARYAAYDPETKAAAHRMMGIGCMGFFKSDNRGVVIVGPDAPVVLTNVEVETYLKHIKSLDPKIAEFFDRQDPPVTADHCFIVSQDTQDKPAGYGWAEYFGLIFFRYIWCAPEVCICLNYLVSRGYSVARALRLLHSTNIWRKRGICPGSLQAPDRWPILDFQKEITRLCSKKVPTNRPYNMLYDTLHAVGAAPLLPDLRTTDEREYMKALRQRECLLKPSSYLHAKCKHIKTMQDFCDLRFLKYWEKVLDERATYSQKRGE